MNYRAFLARPIVLTIVLIFLAFSAFYGFCAYKAKSINNELLIKTIQTQINSQINSAMNVASDQAANNSLTDDNFTLQGVEIVYFPLPGIKISRISSTETLEAIIGASIEVSDITIYPSAFGLFANALKSEILPSSIIAAQLEIHPRTNNQANPFNLQPPTSQAPATQTPTTHAHFNFSDFTNLISKAATLDTPITSVSIGNLIDSSYSKKSIAKEISVKKTNKNIHLSCKLNNGLTFSEELRFVTATNTFSSNIQLQNNNINFTLKKGIEFGQTPKELQNQQGESSSDFKLTINNLNKAIDDLSDYFTTFALEKITSNKNLIATGVIREMENYTIIDSINIDSAAIKATGSYQFAAKPTPQTEQQTVPDTPKDTPKETPKDTPKDTSANQQNSDILTLDIQKLDLPELYGEDNAIKPSYSKSMIDLGASNLRVQVTGSNIKIAKDISINTVLNGSSNSKSFVIDELYGNFGDAGSYQFSGTVEGDLVNLKCNGPFALYGKNFKSFVNVFFNNFTHVAEEDFNIRGIIQSTPRDIMLSSLALTTMNESIEGALNLKMIGKEKILVGNVSVSNVNTEDPNVKTLDSFYQYFKSLFQDMGAKTYTSKLSDLKNFGLKTHISVSAENITLDNVPIQKISGTFSYDQDKMKIDDYTINADTNSLNGKLSISTSGFRPLIQIDFTGGNLIFTEDAESMNRILAYIDNNLNLSQIDWISSGYLDSFTFNNLPFSKVTWIADNKDGSLTVRDASWNILGGSATCTGSFTINPLKARIALALENISIPAVNKLIQTDLFLTDGSFNMNGQISTAGPSFENILKNFYVEGKFIAKDLVFSNLDLDGLITNLSQSNLTQDAAKGFMNDAAASTNTSSINSLQGEYVYDQNTYQITGLTGASNLYIFSGNAAYDPKSQGLALKSTISFFPINSGITDPKLTKPIDILLFAEGSVFNLSKSLTFNDNDAIYQINRLLRNSPSNNSFNKQTAPGFYKK